MKEGQAAALFVCRDDSLPLRASVTLVFPSHRERCRFQGVSKSYAIYDSPGDRLKELLSFNRVKRHKDFWALHDLSFEVKRGETFCIVGENGSGKSTLLQMVGGHSAADHRNGGGERARFGPAGAGHRLQSRIQRPRQRLSERLHPGAHHAADRPSVTGTSKRSPRSATSSTSR